MQGTVIKAYSGYYYVRDHENVIECKLRGRFKKERFTLLVGDQVIYEKLGHSSGVIEEVLPRHSLLRRPMVANVEQVVLTFAACNPDLNPKLIDKFLLLAELSNLGALLCINKIDLADIDSINHIAELYRGIGYPVILISAKTGIGISELRTSLYKKITVFAGPSGVGKSTTLNAIEPGLSLLTGDVSAKIGRGKHTTRYAQLLSVSGGGYVVDTPGFSLAEFDDVNERDLGYYFKEFREYTAHCKFTSCVHNREPQCAVKAAVEAGAIAKQRYQSYIEMLNEIQAKKRGY